MAKEKASAILPKEAASPATVNVAVETGAPDQANMRGSIEGVLEHLPTLDEPCSECDGAGKWHNDAWDRWRADRQAGNFLPPPFQPEEIFCRACRGTGRQPTGKGRILLEFIRKHLGL